MKDLNWLRMFSKKNDRPQVTDTTTWWRHQMETFSAWLGLCAGNLPVPGEFPAQRPVTRSFDVFFDLCLNKRLSKQSWGWWFETLSHPLWRHRNEKRSSVFLLVACLYQGQWWGGGYGRCAISAIPFTLSASLSHWGRDEIETISQTTFSNAFSWMKMYWFRLTFHRNLFPRVQLTIFQHWFR